MTETDIFALRLSDGWEVEVSLSLAAVAVLAVLVGLVVLVLSVRRGFGRRTASFELDTATLGVGKHRFSFKPNETDRQIAYSIWIELSTRKVGLPIDLRDDVISEIYDSWYAFFAVTRELLKSLPVHKMQRDSTRQIVRLSIEVLNQGLRPHLTQWQARFRAWLAMQDASPQPPQDLQREFPHYDELEADLLAMNARLIIYRQKMYELATGEHDDSV